MLTVSKLVASHISGALASIVHEIDAIKEHRQKSSRPVVLRGVAPYAHFATATGYINEYAATGLDEYFAESVRAYVEINDPRCAWLPVTRLDLFLRDPRMFALVDRLFESDFAACERRSIERQQCFPARSERKIASTLCVSDGPRTRHESGKNEDRTGFEVAAAAKSEIAITPDNPDVKTPTALPHDHDLPDRGRT